MEQEYDPLHLSSDRSGSYSHPGMITFKACRLKLTVCFLCYSRPFFPAMLWEEGYFHFYPRVLQIRRAYVNLRLKP